jgi:hypothetical protein
VIVDYWSKLLTSRFLVLILSAAGLSSDTRKRWSGFNFGQEQGMSQVPGFFVASLLCLQNHSRRDQYCLSYIRAIFLSFVRSETNPLSHPTQFQIITNTQLSITS